MFITDFEVLNNLRTAEVQRRDFEFLRNEKNYINLDGIASLKLPKVILSILSII